MNPTLLATLSLLSPLAVAQDQATTLAAGCERAAVVVIATVTVATDPSPDWHRLVFRTDDVLSGQVAQQFTLMEPSGACCGRSLFALGVGEQRLLFLERIGPTLHPLGGARAVLSPEPAIVAHVRELLAAPTAAARARTLALNLQHEIPRIALDAAHALAAMPAPELSAAGRERVTRALAFAVRRGSTQAAPLLELAVRCADAVTVDALLPLYLHEAHNDRARLLRRGLCRLPPELLTGRLPAHLPAAARGDAAAELRAAQLLREVPGNDGQSALSSLLCRTACPRVQLCATEGLLEAGSSPGALRATVPAPILELAEQRVAAARFRSIDPKRR